jgi:altronate dehydratase large subunit
MSDEITFHGFERAQGPPGIRNHVAVIPSVACANGVISAIARELSAAVPMVHGHGCGRGGADLGAHYRTLTSIGRNPNVCAALVVGLGCELVKAEVVGNGIAESGKPVESFEIQEVGGSRKATARGIEIVRRMLAEAQSQQRKPFPISEIMLGMECGGSDAFSGVTANPGVGLVADWLVAQGGTVILTETTEMIGTSHILERRSRDPEVAARVAALISAAEQRTHDILGPLAARVIAPGNMDGGMSSIREKSLGCILKGGSTTINQVVDYGEAPSEKGLVIMDGPGYDVESMAGLAASGCQVMIFTTGRGNPLGFPIVPVVKVASTSQLYEKMQDDMDINAGRILEGSSLQDVADDVRSRIAGALDGEQTKAEINQQDGILALYTVTPSF